MSDLKTEYEKICNKYIYVFCKKQDCEFGGWVAGIVGGIVVGYLSQSQISVSGPAAGLTAIILTAITDLGGFDIFLTAVFKANSGYKEDTRI